MKDKNSLERWLTKMKEKQSAAVLSQKEIAPAVYDMWIGTSLAEQAKP